MGHKGHNGKIIAYWLGDCMQKAVAKSTAPGREVCKWLHETNDWPNDERLEIIAAAMMLCLIYGSCFCRSNQPNSKALNIPEPCIVRGKHVVHGFAKSRSTVGTCSSFAEYGYFFCKACCFGLLIVISQDCRSSRCNLRAWHEVPPLSPHSV